MSGTTNFGYNIGLELTQCYAKYFDHKETELNNLINSLQTTNIEIEIVSDLMNKLSHAKTGDKKFDFDKDAVAKKYAYLIHLRKQSIFEDKIHNVDTGITLEQTLNGIIDQLRTGGHSEAEININAILNYVEPGNMKVDALTEEDIDVIIQGLDAETKMLTADLNEFMMKINNKYDDRSQMTENSRQALKEIIEHTQSIIRKMGR